MKKPLRILEDFKTTLHDESFKQACKMNQQDFTRDRKLPFARLVLFMLNLVRKTLQHELDRFFTLGLS